MTDLFQAPGQIKPEQIFDILVRRRWIIILPLCLTLTLGLFFVMTTPRTYEASTMILVEPQRVPSDYIRSIVTSSINQRISTISQQILSRSNLEKIIEQFGLFSDEPGMYLEDQIESMRRRVMVRIEKTRQGTDAFSIGFKGSDPQRVMQVANTLAAYFMDENLKVREAQAVGTSEFLDAELEKTRKRLAERDKAISEYRAKYLGGLPDELEANLRTLDRLQEQMTLKDTRLQELESQLNVLQAQIAQTRTLQSQQADDEQDLFDFEESMEVVETENERKLAAARETYEELKLKYTGRHPDVIRIKKTIETLAQAVEKEKLQNREDEAEDSMLSTESDLDDGTLDTFDMDMAGFTLMQQQLQEKQIKEDIAKVQSDIVHIEEKMEAYQKRVEETPKREQELQALQRDYLNIKGIFNSLLDRKLEAELAVNMEKKQKGEQFRILDHARLPEKPISPDVKKMFLLSFAAGLGIAAGIIFLLEFFNTAIRYNDQIEKDLGFPVLANIPQIDKNSGRVVKKIDIVFFAGCSLYAMALIMFFVVLNQKGLERTTMFLQNYIDIMN